ncbi:MAG: PEGA domain-containing protein [Fibrobacter sp.]|nr:PEGA domain-containing protein [Fibrobacter sp.]
MRKILAVLFMLLFPASTMAKYVAVLETMSDKDLLTHQERQYLTDVLRGQAVRVLPAVQNWTIMTRENINVMLPPGKSIEDCEGSCLAETGRNIAADFVAQARITKFGNSLAITAEIYETAGNKLVASFSDRGESVDALEKIIRELAPAFFKKIQGGEWSGGGIGGFSTAGSFSFQGNQKFIVEIESQPKGAIPTIDGKAIPKCTSTPCKVQIEAGEHRLVLSRERFDDADTLITVNANNQKIVVSLVPNVGYVDLKPSHARAEYDQYPFSMTIDGEKAKYGKNELAPGIHSVKITHKCYDPLEFQVAIQKGKVETFADTLKVGIGGIELEVLKDGEPQAVPVYVDGVDAGSSPYAGEVPVCAKITVGDDKQLVLTELKWHEVVKTSYTLRQTAFVPVDETQAKATKAYAELDGKKPAPKEPAAVPEEPAAEPEPAPKRFWLGAIVGATYNDFWDTKFGFANLKSGDGYTLKVSGDEDLLGNYWGVGVNAGVGALFLVSPYFGVNADLMVAFRRGSGESDVTVKLYWDDKSQQPEKSDLSIKYSEQQLNIDIPVALRLIVPDVLYAEAGPLMSFNLYSKNKSEVEDIYGSQTYSESGGLSVFEFGLVFGAGTMRHVGKGILDFNLRFVLGITPLSDADDSPKTWQGQFNIGYWFL